MPDIIRPSWPLAANVNCAVCDTEWTICVGDADLIERRGNILHILHVEVACPGCDTRYAADKVIGEHRTPAWRFADYQTNVAEYVDEESPLTQDEIADHMDAVAGVHDVSAGAAQAEAAAPPKTDDGKPVKVLTVR